MTLSATRLVAKGITMTGQESSRNQCLCFLLFHSSLPFLRVLPLLGHFLSHQPALPPCAWSPKRLALVTCSTRCRGSQKQRQRQAENSGQSPGNLHWCCKVCSSLGPLPVPLSIQAPLAPNRAASLTPLALGGKLGLN